MADKVASQPRAKSVRAANQAKDMPDRAQQGLGGLHRS